MKLRRCSCLLALLLGGLTCPPATAQDKKGKETEGEKTDETNEAANLLRRLLKLKSGSGAATKKDEGPPAERKQEPKQEPQPPPTPKPQEKIDEAGKGAAALEKLLPGARKVEEPRAVEEDLELRQPPPRALPVHGSLSLSPRARWSGDDRDADLRAVLALDIGDPRSDRITGHFLGRGNLDLDGRRRVGGFSGIDETFGGDAAGRLYEAYVDVHRLAPLAVARVGRQTILETPIEAYIDGARVKSADFGRLGLWAEVWGGAPSRLYESTSGAWLVGAAVGAAPRRGSALRLDWMHANDDAPTGRYRDDLLGVTLDQSLGRATRLHARYSWLEGDSRDYTLRGTTSIDDHGITAQVTYYELLSTQRAFATEFDPFFTSAFDYFPYRQVSTTVSKQLGEPLTVTAGADLRRLSDRSDEGQFNRDYERLYLSSTAYPLVDQSLSLTVSGDYWNSPGDDTTSLGVDIGARPFREFAASLGSAYALYRFDSFTGREREHVRTYYLRFDYRVSAAVRFDLRYEFDNNDLGRFHELRGGITWRF